MYQNYYPDERMMQKEIQGESRVRENFTHGLVGEVKRKGHFRCSGAFTLVELLVVIAIISILAGMLLPALENAIDTSRSITCMNNQKQIGTVFTFYIDDNNGWQHVIFQKDKDGNATTALGSAKSWPYYLGEYLDMPFGINHPESGPLVYVCPSANLYYNTEINNACYGYNQSIGYSSLETTPPPKITSLQQPSKIFLTADVWQYDTHLATYFWKAPWNGNPSPYHRYDNGTSINPTLSGTAFDKWGWVHNDMLNMLYVDGHVENCQERPDDRPGGFRFSDDTQYYD